VIDEVLKKTTNVFKKIIEDHWDIFKEKHHSFDTPQYSDVIEKMLNCGMEHGGYTEYRCCDCGQGVKRIPFSCKSGFCLSCCKVYVDEVVSQISKVLHVGMRYRHVVLTIPQQLRIYFYKDRHECSLLSLFMRAGYACVEDAVSRMVKRKVKVGCVVVVQTHGRSGSYNPHLHIIMSSGGIDENNKVWKELRSVNYDTMHKKWQYHLLKLMREWDKSKEMNSLIDTLYKQYPRGFVANASKGEAPQKAGGLARYLAKYVASPPISVRRIMRYDGEKVTYKYKDHKTKKEKVETVDAETFVGRMVQHIMPKGFQRIRYYGLQATKTFEKWKEIIGYSLKNIKSSSDGTYEIVKCKNYRERYREGCGKDPLICPHCGNEMVLWEIWHPKYGVIYSEEKEIKRGKYGVA
jgi:hypothetical protein